MYRTLKNRNSVLLIVCCMILIAGTVSAYAATSLMTYNGSGIRQKVSVNSFTLSKSTIVTVKHSTTGVTYIGTNSPSNYTLKIYLQKKNGLKYSNKESHLV